MTDGWLLTALTVLAALLRLFVFRQNLYPDAVGLYVLAIHLDGCRTNRERAGFLGHQHVRVGLLERGCTMAVDERGTAAGR